MGDGPADSSSAPDRPDDYRMSIGDHLEELRRRILFGLIGCAIIFIVCLVFGDQVLTFFCRPLYDALESRGLNSSLKTDSLPEGFSTWITVNLITAVAISSPWLLYQIWLFVAAGLYKHERRTITRYLPLSMALLISGMVLVYTLVLPWTISFFIDFTGSIPTPSRHVTTTQPYTPVIIPKLTGDPVTPREGEVWIDASTSRFKVVVEKQIRSVRLGIDSLITPEQKLSDYIDLVLGMLIMFGLSFQLPLVVMALARMGIVEAAQLRQMRKYVYFILVIVSAAITPGDVLTATVALMVPLCLLYELGIWLATSAKPSKTSE